MNVEYKIFYSFDWIPREREIERHRQTDKDPDARMFKGHAWFSEYIFGL